MKASVKFYAILLTGICLAAKNPASAQIDGSYGDPVINITFGAGTGFGDPFSNLSGYTFDAADCPNDGHYTITSRTYNCFNNAWHTLNSDHTGDLNGRMLIVNASNSPGIFYKETVSSLCSGTTYAFSAWCLNLINTPGKIEPNITFSIEDGSGNVLGRYDSGNIPASLNPAWIQYGFIFTTPANVSDLVLVIRNNAPGGTGNDIAVDDIQFKPWSPKIELNAATSNSTHSFCEGQPGDAELTGVIPQAFTNPLLQWQSFIGGKWNDINGLTGLTANIHVTAADTASLYKYRLAVQDGTTSAACRVYSDSIIIPVSKIIHVDAGVDRTVFQGSTFTLEGKVTGATNYNVRWEPATYLDNPNSLNPVCIALEDIAYKLTGTSTDGCGTIASDQVFIHVNKKLIIPNTFTPNGDNINDKWDIVGMNTYRNCLVQVYNRYGQLIFKSKGYENPWDGNFNSKPVDAGSYMYLIDPGNGTSRLSGWLFVAK